ncbi:MAG: ABC transporter ATP-binding protein, partial [Candidatus Limnocylindrales bacterium]
MTDPVSTDRARSRPATSDRATSDAAIELRGVIHVYTGAETSIAALRGLDLRIEPGQVLAIVGPSGSGKSTLLRILAGLERPTAGSVRILGQDLERATPRRLARYRMLDVATVEQHYWRSISPYLPIRDTVELSLAARGVNGDERRRRAEAALADLGLGDRLDALPDELSGGEQQRVAFASALVTEPRLLLADEPTGELDAATSLRLLGLVREVVHASGTTCVLVTHDESVEEVADRVVHIRDGRVVAERAADDL